MTVAEAETSKDAAKAWPLAQDIPGLGGKLDAYIEGECVEYSAEKFEKKELEDGKVLHAGRIVSKVKRFPSAVIEGEWKSNSPTLRERAMMAVIDQLTDKPGWEDKINDETITAKWRAEAKAMPFKQGFNDAMFDYVLKELQAKADLFRKNGAVVSVFDGAAAVFKNDTVLDADLTDRLRAAVAPLENVPEADKDWHPGSDGLVLDLVHPSLWPLVYGKTRALRDRNLTLEDALDAWGSGDTIPVPDFKPEPKRRWGNPHHSRLLSTKFQWLPAEVDLVDGKARFASYINNLHPKEHKDMYPVLEELVERAVPMMFAAYDRVQQWLGSDDGVMWDEARKDMRLRIECEVDERLCTTGCHPRCDPRNRPRGSDESGTSDDAADFGSVAGGSNNDDDDNDDTDNGSHADENDGASNGADVAPASEDAQASGATDAVAPDNAEGEAQTDDDADDHGPATGLSFVDGIDGDDEDDEDDDEDDDDDLLDGLEVDVDSEHSHEGDNASLDFSTVSNESVGVNAPPAWDDVASDFGVEQYEDWDSDDSYFRDRAWFEETHPIVQPEPGEFKFVGYEYKNEPWRNKRLQVIVKLANIHLTPEKPSYKGGSWHIEGQLNERIVATALYYYDNTNVTESTLAFRTPCDAEAMSENYEYEQNEHTGFAKYFGVVPGLGDHSTVLEFGRVNTRQGRLLTFPNVLQHRVGPFELADKTKPGHRKIVALFLVDPATPVVSTANVPPQQRHWGSVQQVDARLPPEIADIVYGEVGCPFALDEAKRHREELIQERKQLDVASNKAFNMECWSFCEH